MGHGYTWGLSRERVTAADRAPADCDRAPAAHALRLVLLASVLVAVTMADWIVIGLNVWTCVMLTWLLWMDRKAKR